MVVSYISLSRHLPISGEHMSHDNELLVPALVLVHITSILSSVVFINRSSVK